MVPEVSGSFLPRLLRRPLGQEEGQTCRARRRDDVMRHILNVAFAAGSLGVSEGEAELQGSKTPSSGSNKISASLRLCVENNNVGLVCLKGFPKESPPAFVTDAITEHRYLSCSGMQGTEWECEIMKIGLERPNGWPT